MHLGPRFSIGVWLHLTEKLFFNPCCSIIHPSTYSLMYSFICQYFHNQFNYPYASISFHPLIQPHAHVSFYESHLSISAVSQPVTSPPVSTMSTCSCISHHSFTHVSLFIPIHTSFHSLVLLFSCPSVHPPFKLAINSFIKAQGPCLLVELNRRMV